MEIRGPAVAELQKLFLDQWRKHGGVDLPDAGFFPQMGPQGAEVVRVIGSTPDHRIARYYVTLLSAIRNAEKSIWVTNSYFVPTEDLKQDLMAAARRGVDVRLLVPNKTDVKPALAIQRSHYEELLKAGIRIFENPHVVLHAKSVVIDGLWSVVGSSNLDYRSVLFNDEVDVVVLGRATGDAVQRMFENDMRQSKEILPDAWRKRPLLERMNELFSRFLQPWL
jgi:cardiolipin synthase